MLTGYRYRLYPTSEQEVLLAKAFGCARHAYNWVIDQRSEAYANGERTPSKFDLNKRMTLHKKELPWLADVSDWVLKEAISDAVRAYDNFFAKRARFPKYKRRRDSEQSARWRKLSLKGHNHVMIPRIGVMRFRQHRDFDGEVKSATITRSASGRYYISLLVDDGREAPEKPSVITDAVGIDVGLADFAILSTGEKIPNPNFGRYDRRVKGLQKKLARQERGSKRYNRTKQKLAREHEKIADRRRAFLHELSSRIVGENQAVAIEDLNVSGMLRNHSLARSISDASWSELFRMLEYKCERNGVHFMKCNRWEPTSKTCSECGHKMETMPLSVREWACPECGCIHDRDVNAAINILSAASVEYGRGGTVRLGALGAKSTSRRSVTPPALVG